MQTDDIAKWVQKQREDRNLTVQQMHEDTGIARATISAFENGKRIPNLSTFLLLIDRLGFEMEIRKKVHG